MSKPTKKQTAAAPEEALPSYVWLTLARFNDGYVVMEAVSEGDRMVDVKLHNEPDMRAIALEKFRIIAAKKFFGA